MKIAPIAHVYPSARGVKHAKAFHLDRGSFVSVACSSHLLNPATACYPLPFRQWQALPTRTASTI